MIPTYISDYSIFDVPPYLLEQFRDTDVQKLCAVFNRQFQDLELAVFFLAIFMQLQYAQGVNLDTWGKRLGLPRNGRDDDSYRALLLLQGYINNGSGDAETLIRAMRVLFNVDKAHFTFDPPAKIIITIPPTSQTGLYVYSEAEFDDGSDWYTDQNEQFYFREADNAEAIVIQEVLPSGVGLTIQTEES